MSAPADLAPERIASRLATQRLGRSLDVRESTGSTMDDARLAADRGCPEGHVVLADTQTGGRGTHGRAWSSPAGTDLYFSIVLRPPLELHMLAPLTLAVGLGVADGIDALVGQAVCRVKWPNDVLVADAKCAGILVESRSVGAALDTVVVGIGVNVNRRELPNDLGPATSLALVASGPMDRADALAAVLRGIEAWTDRFVDAGPAPIVAALRERLAWRGERVRCDGLEGVLVGVAESGALVIATDQGPVEALAGRVEPVSGR